jgi:YVTN family beta-propeller protein
MNPVTKFFNQPLQLLLLLSASALLLALSSAPTSAGTNDFSVVERTTIGGAGGWDFITLDQPHHRLFIARSDRVQVWDTDSKKVVGEIAGTAGVHGVALAQALDRGFTSNGRANTVTVFSLTDLHVLSTIPVSGANPDAILYEPTSKRVYTFNGRSGDITVIDAVSLKVLATIAVGGKPEVAVSDGDGHIFVNMEDSAELLKIDQSQNKILARWPLAPCAGPTGLAIDRLHQRLFSACDNRTMVVLDAVSGRRVATVPIGGKPDGAEFDPALGMAFSSNGDGTLTVVHEDDPEHFSVAATVTTQDKARTLSLDPVSHAIYLVTALFGATPPVTAEQPKPRPPVLPNSFSILVVAPHAAGQ